MIIKDKEKARVASDFDKQHTESTPQKYFRCGYVHHILAKCTKPPKYNKKRKNKVRFNERVNHALQKEFENGDNYNNKYIYESMAQCFGNVKSPSRYFGDSLQLTNWILDSG